MTLDLAKIKSDAEIIASRCDMLLMTLPVRDVLAMLSEIDRLAFEPAAHSRRLIEELKAENEALRKDAERYRWLRQYTVETLPVAGAMHSLDRQIDEAMSKENS